MSDTTEETKVHQRFYYPNPQISWSEIPESDYGRIEGASIDIDATTQGRLDIWKVPETEANPEGIWVNMFNGNFYEGAEPGCDAWAKHLLAKITFGGHDHTTSYTKDDDHHGTVTAVNGIDYLNPRLENYFNRDKLNPEPVELPSIDDTILTGLSNKYIDLAVHFTGEAVNGSWTVTFTPTNCSVTGLAGEPKKVISSGETKRIAGTMEEINEELKNAQVLCGKTNGTIVFSWDYDQTATYTIQVKEA